MELEQTFKKCNECGEDKSLVNFAKQNGVQYSRSPTCKECRKRIGKAIRDAKKRIDPIYFNPDREKNWIC